MDSAGLGARFAPTPRQSFGATANDATGVGSAMGNTLPFSSPTVSNVYESVSVRQELVARVKALVQAFARDYPISVLQLYGKMVEIFKHMLNAPEFSKRVWTSYNDIEQTPSLSVRLYNNL